MLKIMVTNFKNKQVVLNTLKNISMWILSSIKQEDEYLMDILE